MRCPLCTWPVADVGWREYVARLRAAAELAREALSALIATGDAIVYADALRALDEALGPNPRDLERSKKDE